MLREGPRLQRAGAFKKSSLPVHADVECCLKNGAVVWGPSPGGQKGLAPALVCEWLGPSDELQSGTV